MAANGPLDSLTRLLMDIRGHRQLNPGLGCRRYKRLAKDVGRQAIERCGQPQQFALR